MQTHGIQKYDAVINSPISGIGIRVRNQSITAIDLLHKEVALECFHSEYAELVAQEIQQYFLNPKHVFAGEVCPSGTEYQQSVWRLLQKIPSGKKLTYGQLADQLASGPRAIGNACRNNPIPIIIPCHRVVAKNGLGGFAGKTTGFTVDVKRWLLAHESSAKN